METDIPTEPDASGPVEPFPFPDDDREPARRTLTVPRWTLPVAIIVVALLVAGGAVAALRYRASLVSVPGVIGMRRATAMSTLRAGGLRPTVVGQRFSISVPAGSVLAQTPADDADVRRGTAVRLVLSAGADTIVIPDLVGSRLSDAQSKLESLGLKVVVERVTSNEVRGTVLETYPASGARARTGDTVRLSVSGHVASTGDLLPYDFQDMVIAIDPAPPAAGKADVELDIARRVRALFEASGATAVVSRSLASPSTAIDARASAMASPTPDAVIGIATAAQPGLQAVCLSSNDASLTAESRAIGTAFTGLVQLPGNAVDAPRTATDPVLSRFARPGMRVMLGAWRDSSDAAHLADPDWADAVARAVYRAFGDTLRPR